MSNDGTKVQVFRATKVRTSLKGDGSWIRGSPDPEENLDKLRQENTRESRPLSTRQNSYVLSAAKKFESVTPPVRPSVKKTQSNPVTRVEETSANVDTHAESMSEPAVKTTVANEEVLSVLAVDPPKDEMGPVDSDAPVEAHNGPSSELEKDQSPKAEAKPTAKVPAGLENISIEENPAKPTAESKPANKSQTGQLVQASVEPVLQKGEAEMPELDPEPLEVEAKEPVEAKEEPTLAPVKDEAVDSSGVKTVTPMLAETEMNGSHAVELAADAAAEPAVHAVEVHVESSESLAAEREPVEPDDTPKPIVKTVEVADTEAVIDAADKVAVADDIVEAAAEPIVEAIDKAAVEVAVKTDAAEDVELTAEVIVETVVQAAVKTAAEDAIDQTDKAAVDDAVKTAAAADVVQPVEVIYEAENKTVVGDVVKDAVKTAAAADDVQPVDEVIYEAEEDTVVGDVVKDAIRTAAAADDAIQPIVEPIVDAVGDTVVENIVKDAVTTATAQDFVQPSAKPIMEAVDQTVVEAVDKYAVKPAAAEDAQPAGKPIVETVDKTAVENVVEAAVQTAAASEDAVQSGAKVNIEAVAEHSGLESSINTSVKHAAETPQHVPSSFEHKTDPAVETADDAIVEIPVGVNCSDEPVAATIVAVAEHAVEPDVDTSEAADKIVVENPEPIESVVEPVIEPVAEAIIQAAIESEIKPVEEHVGEASIEANNKAMVEIEPAVEVKEPAAEVVSETVESTSQSTPCSMESQPNQQAETNSKENAQDNVAEVQTIQIQRQTSDGRAICSFCDQTIDGTIKITISEPPMYSHPECFKCGICTKALGDMLTTMFLHSQMVHCDNCFAKTL